MSKKRKLILHWGPDVPTSQAFHNSDRSEPPSCTDGKVGGPTIRKPGSCSQVTYNIVEDSDLGKGQSNRYQQRREGSREVCRGEKTHFCSGEMVQGSWMRQMDSRGRPAGRAGAWGRREPQAGGQGRLCALSKGLPFPFHPGEQGPL